MTIKLLTEHHLEFLRLKGGFTGSSESTCIIISYFWKSRVTLTDYVSGKLGQGGQTLK